MNLKKTLVGVAVAGALGVAGSLAQAAPVATTNVFDMYDPTGALMNVDNTVTGFFDLDAMTWGVQSSTPFSGLTWTASGGVLFGPGTYTVGTSDPGCGLAICASGPDITFTVGAGQIGGQIKFAWGSTGGIDVINVWDASGTSLDVDGDGTPGLGMVDGPFPGFSANFSMTPSPAAVPAPAAVWLFGAGLAGLMGMVRRSRKQATAA